MQKALQDEIEKYQVNESVTLKEGEILVAKSEKLPCNFVSHISCKSTLLSFLYLYYQSLWSSILQSTYKEFNKCTGFSQVPRQSQCHECIPAFILMVFFTNFLIRFHYDKKSLHEKKRKKENLFVLF